MATTKRTKKVAVEYHRNGVEFCNAPEALTGLQKAIAVEALGGNRFRVPRRLTNVGQWVIEVAPLYDLGSGDPAEHIEEWQGIAGLPEIPTEADVAAYLEPRVG